MFKKDLYMKVVFTVIALSLCVIAVQNIEVIKKAEAALVGSGTEVKVTNYETDKHSIFRRELLYVRVKNTDELAKAIAEKLR